MGNTNTTALSFRLEVIATPIHAMTLTQANGTQVIPHSRSCKGFGYLLYHLICCAFGGWPHGWSEATDGTGPEGLWERRPPSALLILLWLRRLHL